jgi:peptidoglycan/LPS O-acetylase OafA/YrhL
VALAPRVGTVRVSAATTQYENTNHTEFGLVAFVGETVCLAQTTARSLDSSQIVWFTQARCAAAPGSADHWHPMTSTASNAPVPIEIAEDSVPLPAIKDSAARAMPSEKSRLPFLDFMRAIASQCIVLHHLVFYGPLPERAQVAMPLVFEWLYDNARMAVQVFFVLGGFFTSRGLGKYKSLTARTAGAAVWSRYRRIGIPYLATLGIAVAANEVARLWMDHEAISSRPGLLQLLAHAAFLHDVLGFQALTAGIWYLAIDFQLFLLTLGLFWVAQAWFCGPNQSQKNDAHAVLIRLMSPLALASLFWFNRDPQYDCWAIYFAGSYFLGVILQAVVERGLRPLWGALYLSAVVAAGVMDPRPRLLVAAGTAVLVYIAARTRLLYAWPKSSVINYFGRTSYSLFLIHFPVLLLVNAWSSRYLGTSTATALWGLGVAYVLSCLAGIGFYHGVESRIR